MGRNYIDQRENGDAMNFREYLLWLEKQQKLFPREDTPKLRQAVHPGRVLKEQYLDVMSLTQSELAKLLDCRFAKVNEIINEKRAITPAFALDLEAVLKVPAEMWISLQAQYDLNRAREKRRA